MFSVTATTTIDLPVKEVFAFIADAENDPRWCPSVKEIERVAGEEPGQGARYRMLHTPGGMKFQATLETKVYQPDERIEWLMTDKGHELHIIYELEPVDNNTGTRLTQTSNVQTRGFLRLPGVLFKRFIQKDIEKEMNKQFQNLKQLLEKGTV